MTASLYLDVMAVLQKDGRQDLVEKFSAFEPKDFLTSTEAARRRMEELRDRNRRRDLAPPDVDDDGSPPLM